MKTKIDWRIIVSGIAGLTISEVVALFNGIDGVLLSSIVAVIALVMGITIPIQLKTK